MTCILKHFTWNFAE